MDDIDAPDDEGAELPDLEAARTHAISAARVLMCETLKEDGRVTLSHHIDIEDERHQPVTSVKFSEAVEILP